MASRHVYDCFDTHGKGHFDSVDTLFDRGVWVGYLAEESRSTRYRQLPSFRELENNHMNLSLPSPVPLPDSPCSDREAVCRGCFGNRSNILQLREIRFGPHSKVVIMPLKGADAAGLFCIMLPQPLDRSIKALESFRPFEHGMDRDDNKSFANDYMLLAIRDRKNNNGVLHTVRTTLDPRELSMIANFPRRSQSDSGPNNQSVSRPSLEKTPQSGSLLKVAKRKQQQTPGDDFEPRNLAKRSRPVTLKGPRIGAHVLQLSDDEMAEPLQIPNARKYTARPGVQQQTPVSPSNATRLSPAQSPTPRETSLATQNVPKPPPIPTDALQAVYANTHFTNEQAQRVHFIWRLEFQGMEHEVLRNLGAISTFHGLLDSFREEVDAVPAASHQMKARLWNLWYKLTNGMGKAVFVNPSSAYGELNFDSLLRSVAENEVWKRDPSLIVEVELRALMSGSSG